MTTSRPAAAAPSRRAVLLAAGGAAALAAPRLARSQVGEPVRVILNWKLEGPNAPFFLAEDRGFFRDAGLAVRLDPGEGSSAPAGRVGSGAYDAGFGDLNALIEFNARFPDRRLVGALALYLKPPMCVVSLARARIAAPPDLVGRRVGAPQNDAAFRLFPVFARATGLDAARVNFLAVQPNIREAMLARGDVEAVTGFDSTVWFSLKGLGVRREDVRFLYYADHGVDVLSNGIMLSPAFARDRPEAARAFVRAVARGWAEAARDPAAATAHITRRERLLDAGLEEERLRWVLDNQVRAPDAMAHGMGHVPAERLARCIATVVEAFGLPRAPAPEEVLDPAFLPPAADRSLA